MGRSEHLNHGRGSTTGSVAGPASGLRDDPQDAAGHDVKIKTDESAYYTQMPLSAIPERKPPPDLAPGPMALATNTVFSSTDDLGSPVDDSKKRRAPIACRRCRRMRSKCVHDSTTPPCQACSEAGLGAEDCIFPVRGKPENDRDFRHPRTRGDKSFRRDPARVRREILDIPVFRAGPVPGLTGPDRASSPVDGWDYLPPVGEIVDAVQRFIQHYFQLGFIPKQDFINRLQTNPRTIDPFLLLSILSVSARLSPPIIARFGGSGLVASEHYMDRASLLSYREVYQEPTLDRCQAFYVLCLAQQGHGFRNKSHMNLGIAIRMAGLMELHEEERYHLANPTKDRIVQAESTRRTMWMLYSQDQLHSGPRSPSSLHISDITALLPAEEDEFEAGYVPQTRAAAPDSPPALQDPSLIHVPDRSLFASLMQAHHFWGIVCRKWVGNKLNNTNFSQMPWHPQSSYLTFTDNLNRWERQLPINHQWSMQTLQMHKARGHDLGYLGVAMIPRICNILIRRPYLTNLIQLDYTKTCPNQPFFSQLSIELFSNLHQLFDQVQGQFSNRSPDESVGAQMAAFCVYTCGLHSSYLCKYPSICPDLTISRDGPFMFHRCIAILKECKAVWPLAGRWLDSLERFRQDPSTDLLTAAPITMADGKDPFPDAVNSSSSLSGIPTPPDTDPISIVNERSIGSSAMASTAQIVSTAGPSTQSPDDNLYSRDTSTAANTQPIILSSDDASESTETTGTSHATVEPPKAPVIPQPDAFYRPVEVYVPQPALVHVQHPQALHQHGTPSIAASQNTEAVEFALGRGAFITPSATASSVSLTHADAEERHDDDDAEGMLIEDFEPPPQQTFVYNPAQQGIFYPPYDGYETELNHYLNGPPNFVPDETMFDRYPPMN